MQMKEKKKELEIKRKKTIQKQADLPFDVVKEENEDEESTPLQPTEIVTEKPIEDSKILESAYTKEEEEPEKDDDEEKDVVEELSDQIEIGEIPVKAPHEDVVRASIAGVKSLFLKKVEVQSAGLIPISNVDIFGALEKTDRKSEI